MYGNEGLVASCPISTGTYLSYYRVAELCNLNRTVVLFLALALFLIGQQQSVTTRVHLQGAKATLNSPLDSSCIAHIEIDLETLDGKVLLGAGYLTAQIRHKCLN